MCSSKMDEIEIRSSTSKAGVSLDNTKGKESCWFVPFDFNGLMQINPRVTYPRCDWSWETGSCKDNNKNLMRQLLFTRTFYTDQFSNHVQNGCFHWSWSNVLIVCSILKVSINRLIGRWSTIVRDRLMWADRMPALIFFFSRSDDELPLIVVIMFFIFHYVHFIRSVAGRHTFNLSNNVLAVKWLLTNSSLSCSLCDWNLSTL